MIKICAQIEVSRLRSHQSILRVNRNLINQKPTEILPMQRLGCSTNAVIDVNQINWSTQAFLSRFFLLTYPITIVFSFPIMVFQEFS